MQQGSNALDEQRRRAAKNQSVFRDLNERIEDLAGSSSFAAFVCECLREDCDQAVSLTIEEYEHVRTSPNRFFVIDGHEVADVEEVVDTSGRYLVVKTLGVGTAVAEKLDPRARGARSDARP